MANTACYDPISKCITLPSDDEGEGIRSILSGSIIEFDDPDFQCGQMLLGEIYEIGEYTLFICCSYHMFTKLQFISYVHSLQFAHTLMPC